jgi:hypothetical protein
MGEGESELTEINCLDLDSTAFKTIPDEFFFDCVFAISAPESVVGELRRWTRLRFERSW